MLDWEDSTQKNSWLFTPELLSECRERANAEARIATSKAAAVRDAAAEGGGASSPSVSSPLYPVQNFASDYCHRRASNPDEYRPANQGDDDDDDDDDGDLSSPSSTFLTSRDECRLIQYYAGMLPNLIGPNARSRRMLKDAKVPATANVFFRRFYLSNSVAIHDPKALMLASAFLASKVEEGMVHAAALVDLAEREGMISSGSSSKEGGGAGAGAGGVTLDALLEAERRLADGLRFQFFCCHPYRAVLALWEDLRAYLKSSRSTMEVPESTPTSSTNNSPDEEVTNNHNKTQVVPITSGDLRPIYDGARAIVEDACVSDVPLLYSTGQIGLAALMVANEDLLANPAARFVPKVDYWAYVTHRFIGAGTGDGTSSSIKFDRLKERVETLIETLRDLKRGGSGCGNYPADMAELKSIHKKLKKCRSWGPPSKKSDRGKKGKGGGSKRSAKVDGASANKEDEERRKRVKHE